MAEPAKSSVPDVVPAIEVRNARTHNLRGIDCRVPHGRVTVVTGPSGAGKSSLAFDTVFAEGQRRFVESMSTYARQFLAQMERPPVDAVDNVLPPVALEARNAIKNARSTVGTITEVQDVLRLLYTHLGEQRCPRGHGPVRTFEPEEAAAELASGAAGESFLLVARVPRPKKGSKEALAELVRQGFSRRLGTGGEIQRMAQGSPWPAALAEMPLVLGRFRARPDIAARLVSTVEEGYRLGGGRIEAVGLPAKGDGDGEAPGTEPATLHFSRELGCPVCGTTVRRPTPALFSFNSPLGACETCQGFGRVTGIDPGRVLPDPTRSLEERPIAPWNSPAYEDLYDDLHAACRKRGIPLGTPWEELSEEAREFVWSGREKGFTSVEKFFRWLERKTYKVHVRVLLARYRSYDRCPDCGGARLAPEGRAVTLEGMTLPELAELSIERLREWLGSRRWSERQREVAGHLIEQLEERVEVLHRVGLDYLTLARQARTLSGGEAQRIHLASALGSGLTSTLYVLDEPTIGLHPQDSARLLALLRDLAARGNTVLVVEHDRTLVHGADHLIDLGPAAGEHGGRVMAEGTVEEVLAHPTSLTARHLPLPEAAEGAGEPSAAADQEAADGQEAGSGPKTAAREHLARYRRERGVPDPAELADLPRVGVRGAREHNLRGIDVELPLGALVAVTGVSGSGKSTLVEDVLYGSYQRSQGVGDVDAGAHDELVGLDRVSDVTMVDQRPLGRSSRSNPVTYVKAYDDIRKLLAATPEAKRRGIRPGHFSFNVDRGRCPQCKGTGEVEVDMHFMAAVTVPCDECQGHRFRPEVLAVTYRGANVSEILELTVDQALDFFVDSRGLQRRLGVLADVGLGYLRLGQSTSTLSGGEAQRLKLASFLDRPAKDGVRLFLFDEPTTGLHVSDVDVLLDTFRRLVARGDGVVVVEHSLELVARADWIVDLGPGGGSHGGDLLFSGPLERFLAEGESPTARELRAYLRSAPKPAPARTAAAGGRS